jgi:outer membrane protein TolC
MTVFDGFRNVQEYRRARTLREEFHRAREETALSVLLQVLDSYRQLQTVRDQATLARQWRAAARARGEVLRSGQEAGFETWSRRLEAEAALAEAGARADTATLAETLALFAFRSAVGQPMLDAPSSKGNHP